MATTNFTRFIPLPPASQNTSENVLFYDNQASIKAIIGCATARLEAVINLLSTAQNYSNIETDTVIAICVIAKFVLSDTGILVSALEAKF